jgi:hypothetical protein
MMALSGLADKGMLSFCCNLVKIHQTKESIRAFSRSRPVESLSSVKMIFTGDGNVNLPRFTCPQFVQFGFTSLTIVVFWSRRSVSDSYTETVLPNMALVTLDEEAVRISLIIVTTLVLLMTANTSCDFVFL